ncbi:YgdI/YgdR family lipoprotein [Algoriphagus namhaensis]
MKKLGLLCLLFFFFSCEELIDVEEITGNCTIILIDGTTITTQGIELLKSTETITYRDENGKLWSLFRDDYESYSCN